MMQTIKKLSEKQVSSFLLKQNNSFIKLFEMIIAKKRIWTLFSFIAGSGCLSKEGFLAWLFKHVIFKSHMRIFFLLLLPDFGKFLHTIFNTAFSAAHEFHRVGGCWDRYQDWCNIRVVC
jgi:hypothetical protein